MSENVYVTRKPNEAMCEQNIGKGSNICNEHQDKLIEIYEGIKELKTEIEGMKRDIEKLVDCIEYGKETVNSTSK